MLHLALYVLCLFFLSSLTNEEVRKNWEQYGNPDGPGAMTFGIALPKWIVERENSIVVLGIYLFVFMICLPSAVVSPNIWGYLFWMFLGSENFLYNCF